MFTIQYISFRIEIMCVSEFRISRYSFKTFQTFCGCITVSCTRIVSKACLDRRDDSGRGDRVAVGGRGVINVFTGNRHKADDRSLPVLRVNTVLLAKGFLVIDVSLMTSRTSFVRAARPLV